MMMNMLTTTQSALKAAFKAATARSATNTTTVRSISIGTDMHSSVIQLQKARPWHMAPQNDSNSNNSNLAVDNAVSLDKLFENRTVAVFGVPAPFTGTCTMEHVPGYQKAASQLHDAGVDKIVCYSVSDPYALQAWEQTLITTAGAHNIDSNNSIEFLADPTAMFARAYGVDAVYDECSLGLRSKRFSMIVRHGIVHTFRLVEDAAGDAETMLDEMKEIKENEQAA